MKKEQLFNGMVTSFNCELCGFTVTVGHEELPDRLADRYGGKYDLAIFNAHNTGESVRHCGQPNLKQAIAQAERFSEAHDLNHQDRLTDER